MYTEIPDAMKKCGYDTDSKRNPFLTYYPEYHSRKRVCGAGNIHNFSEYCSDKEHQEPFLYETYKSSHVGCKQSVVDVHSKVD